jgi:hypothetical protein
MVPLSISNSQLPIFDSQLPKRTGLLEVGSW